MKEEKFGKLAQELAELFENMPSFTVVEVIQSRNSLELHPAKDNDGTCFYHLKEVADFCRRKKLDTYIGTNPRNNKIICIIY